MPCDPQKYREQAQACRTLAIEAKSPDAREHYFNLALDWEQLAADAESSLAFIQTMTAVAAALPDASRTSD
jgi:hypothetical protein